MLTKIFLHSRPSGDHALRVRVHRDALTPVGPGGEGEHGHHHVHHRRDEGGQGGKGQTCQGEYRLQIQLSN